MIADKGIGKLLMIERGNRVIGVVFCGILSGMNNVPPSMSSKGSCPAKFLSQASRSLA
ncbi:hypothetical protein NLY43_06650 [Mesorhizobium sp. C416B]|uniref:hypothetical protein n=1 Tax=unclassified Mesorhizobium TaxID=325217 RepID=UPI001FDA1C2C|nr:MULTISPECIES: hypothetical protein [unclassified Mesorhizobium]WJI64436.1 hypothetical protein NLY43_06650 [Mesorhizobium sp. C416B]